MNKQSPVFRKTELICHFISNRLNSEFSFKMLVYEIAGH